MRPTILVTSPARGGFGLWGMSRVLLFLLGADPTRARPGDELPRWSEIDGVVLGGGVSIDPAHYDEPIVAESRLDPDRDALELHVLANAYARGLPVLGICRGCQLLNVFRGGSLHQELMREFPRHSPRRQLRAVKRVLVDEDTRVHDAIERSVVWCNSIHRQGVARVGEGLRVSARDELGVVQAIEDVRARFVLGVQWHPELLPHRRAHRALFRALVAAARFTRAGGGSGTDPPEEGD
ncbi:MAG: gamma-glutamyl-gamma-aminobutyrate hydrolase family protein [Sandaracinaceae bacterium]